MMRSLLTLTGALLGWVIMAQEVIVPLDTGWVFKKAGDENWWPASVPGSVQRDLQLNGNFKDRIDLATVDSMQWVEREDWTYRTTLNVSPELLRFEHVELVFKGLDTYAEVTLDGMPLGTANNMFRSWTWPVHQLLKPGPMELLVKFKSPVLHGERARQELGIPLPHDSDPTGTSPYVRKAAYQYGWDFCPRIVTMGIWQGVELRCWSGCRIGEVKVSQAFVAGDAVIGVKVTIEGEVPADAVVVLDIDGDRTTAPVDRSGIAKASLSIVSVRRWWPIGAGEQVLYPVRVELRTKGAVHDNWERRMGWRTVALDQHAGAFTFMVNDRAIFCKGANLVPPTMFPGEGGDSAWVALVRHMSRAHFNMVRIWAGGLYPPDAFFEACDTAGILVWQDLMFANVPPPGEAFMENVAGEIRDQAVRMRDHPSLALWCGNNELDVAWHNWGWQQRYGLHGADSSRIAAGMTTFFARWLPDQLALFSDVPYTPTSPLSNWGRAEGLRTGDLHYWGVWHGDSSIMSFGNNVGRFMSEYGFQSYPDSVVLARVIPPEQLWLGSPALQRLQRSYKTDAPIWKAIAERLGTRPDRLADFIAASQKIQADAYRLAIEAHLAARPQCMGTLFWQLNDPWPGPSWSLIDAAGRWKPGMYAVQELYGR